MQLSSNVNLSQKEIMYNKGLKDVESLSPKLKAQWDDLINNHPWIIENKSKANV